MTRPRARTVLLAALALLGLGAIGFVSLHIPAVQQRIFTAALRMIASRVDGELSVGDASYRLWRGEVAAEELLYHLRLDGLLIEVEVPRVEARYGMSGLELSVTAPSVVFTTTESDSVADAEGAREGENEPATRGPPLEPRLPDFIRAIAIDEARVLWVDAEQDRQAELGPFALDLVSEPGASGLSGRLVLEDGLVRAGDETLHVLGGSTTFDGDGSSLRVERGRFDLDVGSVSPEAEIRSLDPLEADLVIDFRLDGAELGAFLGQPSLGGRFRGSASLSLRPDALSGRGVVSASQWRFREIGPLDGELEWRLDDRTLHVESLAFNGYGGELEANARLELSENGRQTAVVRWRDLSLPSLLRAARVEAPWQASGRSWHARSHGEADLGVTGWRVETLTGTSRVELEGDVMGRVTASAEDGDVVARTEGVRFPGGELRLRAQLDALEEVVAEARLTLDDVGRFSSGLATDISARIEGGLVVEASARGRLDELDAMRVSAVLDSERLVVNEHGLDLRGRIGYADGTVRIEDVEARVAGERQNAESGSEAELPGGVLRASGVVPLARNESASVALTLQTFPLRAVPLLRRGGIESGRVSGEIQLLGDVRDPEVEADLTLAQVDYRGLQLSGRVSAARVDGTIRARSIELRLPSAESGLPGEVTAEGFYDPETGELSVGLDVVGIPLRRTLTRVLDDADWPPSLDARLARADVSLSGTLSRPEGRANIRLDEVTYRGEALPSASLQLSAPGDGTMETELVLEPGGSILTASTELQGDYPTAMTAELRTLPWETILGAVGLEARNVQIAGRVDSRLPLLKPTEVVGEARLTRLSAEISGASVTADEAFEVSVSDKRIDISGLSLVGDGLDLDLDGAMSRIGEPEALTVRGSVDLAPWKQALGGDELAGTARLDVELEGAFDRPRLTGTVAIENGRYAKGPILVEQAQLTARAAGAFVVLEKLDAVVTGGRLTAEGALPIPGATLDDEGFHDYGVEFRLEGSDFAPFLLGPREAEARNVEASVSLEGELSWQGRELAGLEASGVVSQLALRSPAVQATAAGPARFIASGDRFELEAVHIRGNGTDVTLDAGGSFDDWAASARGELNLLLAGAVLPSTLTVNGSMTVDASLRGGTDGLRTDGSMALENAALIMETPPLALSDVNAAFRLENREVVLEHLRAAASGGTLEAEGTLAISEGSATHIEIQARSVRLEYPEGLRSEIDAELELAGAGGSDAIYDLSGRVVIDQARYERDLSVERELLRSIRSRTVQLAREPGFSSRLRLDIDVDSARDVVVDNNLGQIRAEVNVLVTGTAASPAISGTVRAREGGELRFAGNEYEVETARVDLIGYPATPPEIDVRARTEAGGYDLELALSGPLDNLRTELNSPGDPTLSRADVASLLITGRTLEGVRGEEGRVVGEQAAKYLGGGLADLTETGLEKALPITTISVTPTVVGSETDPGARLSLGQALSENLLLTYSLGLNDTESQLWIVDYELPRGFALRAVRDDRNEYTGTLWQRVLFDIYERERPVELRPQKGPEIRAVRVEGPLPPSVPARKLRDAPRFSEGDRFEYWRAQEDAEKMLEELREAGYLRAMVEVDTAPVEGSDAVVLTYTVRANEPIEISWSGDDPGESLRREARESWGAYLPPSAVARQTARRIARNLQSDGYYGAVVEPHVLESDDRTEVRFEVERGEKGDGVELRFTGNQAIEDERLEELFPDPSTPEFFRVVQEKQDDLRESVRLFYATEGYLDARVVEVRERFDQERGVYEVAVSVEEGEPSRLAAVVLEGVESFEEDAIRDELELEPGALFRLGDFLEQRQAINAFYRSEGFRDVRVRSQLERSETGEFEAVYEVEEGQRIVVGDIRFVGSRVTDESVMRRAVGLSPGKPVRLEDLIETQSRLYDLHVFRSVDVRSEPTRVPGVHDVVVEVVERPDVSASYGVRYSTEELWEVTGSIDLPNLLGDARRLNLFAFLNRDNRAFRGTYSVPYFFGFDVDTALFVERQIETDESLSSRSWAVTFQQGRGEREAIRTQWSYTFRRARVAAETGPNDPFAFDVVANRGLITGSLIHDSRDSLTSPRRGWLWNVTSQAGAAFLGSDLRFLSLYGQAFHFRPVIGGGIIWASSYRAGIARPFGDQVLLPGDRFQAGGPNSVRGFPLDELGPVDPSVGARIGGEGVIVMNQELRIPVWRRFGAVAFYDAGNVYLDVNDFDPTDLRHSLGLGLRVSLPFGLARVDWARVLNPQAGLDASRLHISFGHAF